MKRVFAMCAVFGLAALIAACVALAPLAPSLDPGAARSALGVLDAAAAQIIALAGRGGAVVGLLGLGIVLALLVAVAIGDGKYEDAETPVPNPAQRNRRKVAEPEPPAPAWRSEPLSPEDRLASLKRRAASGDGADDSPAVAAPSPPTPAPAPNPPPPAFSADLPSPPTATEVLPPRPVALIRKPRERERDWFGDTSWLGGLPRLAGVPWPRDGGLPLPFAAQIDLAELALACPETPLPRSGSLAFFLGTGAVVAVPEGEHDFSDPPHDLPPAYDEGGYPFPPRANRLSRHFFPFWPVTPVALDLPEALRGHHGDAQTAQAITGQLAAHASLRDHPFYAFGVGAPVEALWWHGVIHLADQLHEALEASNRPIAIRRDALERTRGTLAGLSHDPARLAQAQEKIAGLKDDLARIEEQRSELPLMVEALDGFIAGRKPWDALTAEEREIVADILSEVHERYGELVRFHAPGTLAQLATLSLRAMISGPPEALDAMPEDMLARINRDYRLAPEDQHQMFGPVASGPHARDEHRGDILLLQLGYDDMMEWSWGEAGRYQFWISPADAAAGNWQTARLTFESA